MYVNRYVLLLSIILGFVLTFVSGYSNNNGYVEIKNYTDYTLTLKRYECDDLDCLHGDGNEGSEFYIGPSKAVTRMFSDDITDEDDRYIIGYNVYVDGHLVAKFELDSEDSGKHFKVPSCRNDGDKMPDCNYFESANRNTYRQYSWYVKFFNNSLRDGDVYMPKSLGLGRVTIERNALPYKKSTITLAREHAYDFYFTGNTDICHLKFRELHYVLYCDGNDVKPVLHPQTKHLAFLCQKLDANDSNCPVVHSITSLNQSISPVNYL
ncbi:MAG: hypothetical protein EP298_04660 [Gammaproteobacteria bacterium]|nr:MAG: hypothetical protein EP298_04660 [Gammaproteobacteria bacterium]UTW42577.1 hypothetical protein KFE69_00040 [bacterium SCSIO 12844]